MSSFAYGVLTGAREETEPVPKKGESSLGPVKAYIDAVAALVPAEILAFHALALQFTTESVEAKADETIPGAGGESIEAAKADPVTVITDPTALKWVFVGLLIAAPLLYWLAHRREHASWHASDWLRMLVPALAFVAWTMLQKSTAFDALDVGMSDTARTLAAAALAVVLGLAATQLAYKADGSHP